MHFQELQGCHCGWFGPSGSEGGDEAGLWALWEDLTSWSDSSPRLLEGLVSGMAPWLNTSRSIIFWSGNERLGFQVTAAAVGFGEAVLGGEDTQPYALDVLLSPLRAAGLALLCVCERVCNL